MCPAGRDEQQLARGRIVNGCHNGHIGQVRATSVRIIGHEHVCRLQIMPSLFRVMKDDHDKDGPDKAALLDSKKVELKPGTWYHARIALAGPEMTATVGDVSGGGTNDLLAVNKASFALVVSGQTASFKNLRMTAR